jgi:hypothetical protein
MAAIDTEPGRLFLAHSIKKLEQMTGHIESCLQKLNDHNLWDRSGGHENAVGNLVLHLQGNVRQWIGHGIGGEPDIRHRDAEFSATGDLSAAELAGRIRGTVNQAIEILKALPPEKLTERVKPQDDELSMLEVVYQAVGHFQQHTGQIMFATKQLTGEGLNFYRPPAPDPRKSA